MPYKFLRRTLLPLLAKRIKVEGLEFIPERGPYLLVANHQSYLDGLMLSLTLVLNRNVKVWFLTTEHIWRFFKRFGGIGILQWLGMIQIYNQRRAESLEPARKLLEQGGVIAVFPEAMRNKPSVNPDWERVMLKGKTGAARLALATEAPVIPAGIIAPKGLTAFQALRNFFIPLEPALVRFGRPLQFPKTQESDFHKELLNEVTRKLMQEVSKLCGKEYPY